MIHPLWCGVVMMLGQKWKSQCCRRIFCRQQERSLAVYAIGDGWTGAMGAGSLECFVPGHQDDEDPGEPLLVHDGDITSVSAGWGHSALITADGKLLVTGRPSDFSNVLRLKRLPAFMRRYAINHSLRNSGENANLASPSVLGYIVSLMVGSSQEVNSPWKDAEKNSILMSFSRIQLPGGEIPSAQSYRALDTSAGLTAVLTEKGNLLTFGLNHHGQCGVGEVRNNVWTPQPVMGLSTQFAHEGRAALEPEFPVVQVALGLQHGIALNQPGHLYVWGKGERGQLGIHNEENSSLPFAKRVRKFRVHSNDGSQKWTTDPVVTCISAGMNHSAALTDSNHVFIWGKNVAASTEIGKKVEDSPSPVAVRGLPQNKSVVDVACGSHHTSILMEDGSVYATGVSKDNAETILVAYQQVPPGIIEVPCRQFEAHFDRTTIVGKDGDQIMEVQVWSDEELRQNAIFTPAWKDNLPAKIKRVHRGWLHTLIVTD